MNFLDRFTSIDDLLVSLIERIGGVTEEDTHFFSYPNDGSRATIVKGTTTLDFMQGTVMDTAGVVSPLGNSLRARGREYCRSLSLQADQDIIVQIGTKSKIPIFAGTWFKVAHLRFTDVKIIATQTTHVFVIGCTNPDSIEMIGETYVKDPVDEWGGVTTIGNCELGVRTHAPPLTFDRRGDILDWIDFESGTPNYEGSSYGARSTDVAKHGDFSYKITTKNSENGFVTGYTNDVHGKRTGVQTIFSTASGFLGVSLRSYYYVGGIMMRCQLGYNINLIGEITILGSDGVDITIATGVTHYASIYNFSSMKLVVDFENKKYLRAIVFGVEYDISDYDIRQVAAPTAKLLSYGVSSVNPTASEKTLYIDCMIATENEPLNNGV